MFKKLLNAIIHGLCLSCVCCLMIVACGQSSPKQKAAAAALPHYDLSQPTVYKLPAILNEISGIAFQNGQANVVFAEQDEEGKLFRFALASKDVAESRFAKKGDYEDVQIFNNQVIVLRSDGVLYSFALPPSATEATNVKELKKLLPDGEYEGMFVDEASSKLYVLCKHCNEKVYKTNTVYVLRLDADGNITPETNITIDVAAIAGKIGDKKINFQPSALAWSSKNNEWFIVSSVNKILVTADKDWKVTAVYPLNEALFNQPEGIAFDKDGNLYISNEKGNTSSATILKINYQPL